MSFSESATTATTTTTTIHHVKQDDKMNFFRSALAINNSGVSLLEKGHFREAQKTFWEALTFMKQALKPSTAFSTSTNVHETLQSVSNRLVRAQVNPVLTAFEICAFEDGDDLSNIQSSLKYGPSSSIFFPFRIRSSQDPTFCHVMEKELDRPMAIILYNRALSHFLWGQSDMLSRSKMVQEKHSHAALSCLSMAQSVLSQHLSSRVKDSFQEQCSMLVQAFVLNNLVQVLLVKNRLGLVLDDDQSQQHLTLGPKSLEDWIKIRDNLLKECDSMDEYTKHVSAHGGPKCSMTAAAA
jgi:hypothetical protein